ncbi:hypothetical protein BJV74DRAFT_846834, partial [Russula compacta]
SHNIALVVIVIGLTVFVFVFSIRAAMLGRYSRDRSLIWLLSVGMGGTTLTDLLIALSMSWCLYHRRTGFSR